MYNFVKSNGTIALVQDENERYLVVDRRTDEVLKRTCDKDTGLRAYDRTGRKLTDRSLHDRCVPCEP